MLLYYPLIKLARSALLFARSPLRRSLITTNKHSLRPTTGTVRALRTPKVLHH